VHSSVDMAELGVTKVSTVQAVGLLELSVDELKELLQLYDNAFTVG